MNTEEKMSETNDENKMVASTNPIAALEALLFIHGEPLTFKKIQSVLGIETREELDALVANLAERLAHDERGLQLISDREKIQLATKPAFNSILEAFVKEEISEELSPASVEALSIIAYLGPISRAKLEYLRGVNSSVILRSLMIRGLIERFPDPKHPSIFLYRPTFDLMKHLGVQEKEALPEFEKFRDLLKVFEAGTAEVEKAPVEASLVTSGSEIIATDKSEGEGTSSQSENQ
jgi:segregation and condensation protein B